MEDIMEDIVIKSVVVDIIKDYCEDNESIQDSINKFKSECLKALREPNTYAEKIAQISFMLNVFSKVIMTKKLKDNKKDLLPLKVFLLSIADEISDLVEEE